MKSALLSAACLTVIATPALAQDVADPAVQTRSDPWFVRAGPAEIWYHDGAKISLNGTAVPGASLKATNNTTVEIEGGYFFNPNISASLTVGGPPTISLYGQGPLDGTKLGRVTYAPAVAAVQYHLTALGRYFVPYVGSGIGYAIVLKNHDRAIQQLHVNNLLGVTLQAGAESRLTRRFGVFADVKQIYFTTNARGSVQGAPASAKVQLDPTIVSAGIMLHL